MPGTRLHLDATPLCLLLAVAAVYANAVGGSFQFDDFNVIVNNPAVQTWQTWRESGGIRPLLKWSYLLNWTTPIETRAYHITNITLHLFNTLLVYRLTCVWLHAQKLPEAQATKLPLWSALLFALHPMHTEAVTYICGRSVSFMAMIYLAGLWVYAEGRARSQPLHLHMAVPALFALALGVKETAVTFPFALLLWELSLGSSWRTAWRLQMACWALLLVAAVLVLFSDAYLNHMHRSAAFNGLLGNAATQVRAFGYLWQQWWLPLWPNIDPDLPVLRNFATPQFSDVWLPLAVLGMVRTWRQRPWIAFALAWALLHCVPLYLLLPRLDVANDRQLYLAVWPLGMALSVELTRIQPLRTSNALHAALCLSLAVLTLARNADYATEITLWESTSQNSPYKARVHNNLGYAYHLAHRPEDAQRAFRRALEIDPGYVRSKVNLERVGESEGETRRQSLYEK